MTAIYLCSVFFGGKIAQFRTFAASKTNSFQCGIHYTVYVRQSKRKFVDGQILQKNWGGRAGYIFLQPYFKIVAAMHCHEVLQEFGDNMDKHLDIFRRLILTVTNTSHTA